MPQATTKCESRVLDAGLEEQPERETFYVDVKPRTTLPIQFS